MKLKKNRKNNFIIFNVVLSFCAFFAVKAEDDCLHSSQLMKQAALSANQEAAKQLYLDAIKICPTMSEAHHNLAVVLAKKGDLNEALEVLKKALEAKDDIRYRLTLASILIQKKEFQAAESQYNLILSKDEQNVKALQGKAVSLEKQLRYEEATAILHKALLLSSGDIETHFTLAAIYSKQEKYPLAIEQYNEVLRLKNDHFEAKYHLGLCLWKTGRTAEAKDILEQAVGLNPNDATIQRTLGFLYESLQQYDKSELAFRKALSIDNTDTNARMSLGAVLLNKKQYLQAIEEEGKILEVEPNNARVNAIIGIAHLKMGKLDLAETYLKRSIEIDSSCSSSNYNLGVVLEKKGLKEESQKYFEIAKKLQPDLSVE